MALVAVKCRRFYGCFPGKSACRKNPVSTVFEAQAIFRSLTVGPDRALQYACWVLVVREVFSVS